MKFFNVSHWTIAVERRSKSTTLEFQHQSLSNKRRAKREEKSFLSVQWKIIKEWKETHDSFENHKVSVVRRSRNPLIYIYVHNMASKIRFFTFRYWNGAHVFLPCVSRYSSLLSVNLCNVLFVLSSTVVRMFGLAVHKCLCLPTDTRKWEKKATWKKKLNCKCKRISVLWFNVVCCASSFA